MKKLLLGLLTITSFSSLANVSGDNSYYSWGKANNGYGYCYKYNYAGNVLNGGKPFPDDNCDQNAIYYAWSTSNSGYTYCYKRVSSRSGDVLSLNDGKPVSDDLCN